MNLEELEKYKLTADEMHELYLKYSKGCQGKSDLEILDLEIWKRYPAFLLKSAKGNGTFSGFLTSPTMCRIPENERKAKIEYLEEHFMPVILENGELNPIFKMSNKHLLQVYGIDKKTLIANYTNQRENKTSSEELEKYKLTADEMYELYLKYSKGCQGKSNLEILNLEILKRYPAFLLKLAKENGTFNEFLTLPIMCRIPGNEKKKK